MTDYVFSFEPVLKMDAETGKSWSAAPYRWRATIASSARARPQSPARKVKQ